MTRPIGIRFRIEKARGGVLKVPTAFPRNSLVAFGVRWGLV